MTQTTTRRAATLLLASLALTIASCASNDNVARSLPDTGATLEGTIKVGSEPLHFAMVMVKSPSGVVSGKIGEDGKYKVSNVPIGDVQVGVNTSAAQGDFQAAMMQAGAMGGGADGKSGRKKVDVKMIHVKDQYVEPTSSGLKTTIKAGANTYDIELPAAAKK
jgi:hypothetical protein